MFAIIDVETTGLNARTEKITEIAIITHDGNKVIDEFSTLINPEKRDNLSDNLINWHK